MVLKIALPEDVTRSLEARWGDVPRHVIETLAIEGYRDGTLSHNQIQSMLGFESRFEVDAFLRERRVPLSYDVEDLEHDAEALRELRPTRSR
jgi:predicted HTH domain antitoxin